MAKRLRGGSRQSQRRSSPPQPRETTNAAPRPAASLTAEEEARAAEIEAQILADERAAQERAAQETQRRNRERMRGELGRARDAVPLSVRASQEYAYVRRDLGRIGAIAGILLAVLAVLHVLINIAGVITL